MWRLTLHEETPSRLGLGIVFCLSVIGEGALLGMPLALQVPIFCDIWIAVASAFALSFAIQTLR